MRPVEHPIDSVKAAYLACVRQIRNSERKDDFVHALEAIEQAAAKYERAAERRLMHLLNPKEFQPEDDGMGVTLRISSKDLAQGLYERRMAKEGASGREVYDRIRVACDICPLCGVRDVKTID